jgi:hypothetical protein
MSLEWGWKRSGKIFPIVYGIICSILFYFCNFSQCGNFLGGYEEDYILGNKVGHLFIEASTILLVFGFRISVGLAGCSFTGKQQKSLLYRLEVRMAQEGVHFMTPEGAICLSGGTQSHCQAEVSLLTRHFVTSTSKVRFLPEHAKWMEGALFPFKPWRDSKFQSMHPGPAYQSNTRFCLQKIFSFGMLKLYQ